MTPKELYELSKKFNADSLDIVLEPKDSQNHCLEEGDLLIQMGRETLIISWG